MQKNEERRADHGKGRRKPAIEVERRADGSLLLRCPYPPGPLPHSLPQLLLERAQLHGDRPLLAERAASGEWCSLTYAEAAQRASCVAQGLLNRGLGAGGAVMILSPRSFDHFALAFGAMMAGVPVCPVSAPYSLLSRDHEQLKQVVRLVSPSLVMVDDLGEYADALQSLFNEGLLDHAEILLGGGSNPRTWSNLPVSSMSAWYGESATADVARALEAVSHDTVARYMFTSGSTGMPKAVIYTQRMMCAQLAQGAGLTDPTAPGLPQPPRILDWMPWSHTGAGVMRLNAAINAGGTIFFDTGRPVPREFDETLRNLREVRPTALSGAPIGYAMLADALERDDELNRLVFGAARSLGFGSAAMPPALFERLQSLSIRATGQRIGITSSLASTEVLGCLSAYWPMADCDNVGLPVPGATVKLVPNGGKLEIRIKSQAVTPGYLKDPVRTAESFDEEGFFKMGDAVRFVDPVDPAAGLVFDGRISEQFKLSTGTWVSPGTLRSRIVAAASPYVRDAVICGLNEEFVAVMLWPSVDACASALALDASKRPEVLTREIMASRRLCEAIAAGIRRHNEDYTGSSTRIARFTLLEEPPSARDQEITEKGYVNQRFALERRADVVRRLYADPPDPGIYVL